MVQILSDFCIKYNKDQKQFKLPIKHISLQIKSTCNVKIAIIGGLYEFTFESYLSRQTVALTLMISDLGIDLITIKIIRDLVTQVVSAAIFCII